MIQKSPAKELVIKKYEIDEPSKLTAMSVTLKKHIVAHKLYTPIMGRNYAHVEGWQFAGGMLGLLPKVVAVESMSNGSEIKWKAEVEIIEKTTGNVVGAGFAICSNKESKKKSFDEYAILSMAQTRAIGKAYRNLIGWVMKLAGYEGTPSEEMMKVGEEVVIQGQPSAPAKDDDMKNWKECSGGCGAVVSPAEEKYSMRVYKRPLCRACQSKKRK